MKVRFTIRTLMALVAIVGVILWYGVSTARRHRLYAVDLKFCEDMEGLIDQSLKSSEAGLSIELERAKSRRENTREYADFYREQIEDDRKSKADFRKHRIDLWWKIFNPFAR